MPCTPQAPGGGQLSTVRLIELRQEEVLQSWIDCLEREARAQSLPIPGVDRAALSQPLVDAVIYDATWYWCKVGGDPADHPGETCVTEIPLSCEPR